jgi:hypothetical protein
MNNILEGKIQPVVWSPGSDLWVTSINRAWQDRTGARLSFVVRASETRFCQKPGF